MTCNKCTKKELQIKIMTNPYNGQPMISIGTEKFLEQTLICLNELFSDDSVQKSSEDYSFNCRVIFQHCSEKNHEPKIDFKKAYADSIESLHSLMLSFQDKIEKIQAENLQMREALRTLINDASFIHAKITPSVQLMVNESVANFPHTQKLADRIKVLEEYLQNTSCDDPTVWPGKYEACGACERCITISKLDALEKE